MALHKVELTSIKENVDKNNVCALLVGMQTGAAIMENSMEVSQKKNKNSILYDPVIQLLDINMQKMRILAQKDTYSHIYCTNITHNSKI